MSLKCPSSGGGIDEYKRRTVRIGRQTRLNVGVWTTAGPITQSLPARTVVAWVAAREARGYDDAVQGVPGVIQLMGRLLCGLC